MVSGGGGSGGATVGRDDTSCEAFALLLSLDEADCGCPAPPPNVPLDDDRPKVPKVPAGESGRSGG